MKRLLPFPFPGNRFPADLGAVVQRSVLDGRRPALYVGHTDENDWIIGDGVEDPNLDGATVAAHVMYVVERDPSLAGLATLPTGMQAWRESADAPWQFEPFEYLVD